MTYTAISKREQWALRGDDGLTYFVVRETLYNEDRTINWDRTRLDYLATGNPPLGTKDRPIPSGLHNAWAEQVQLDKLETDFDLD